VIYLLNVVGIDKDYITLDEAKQLKTKIQQEQKCQVLLWQTKHGFHLELVYLRPIPKKKNFQIREQYNDCPERMRISHLRGEPYDILFSIKDGFWRKYIG
jgi:hypothetical protein